MGHFQAEEYISLPGAEILANGGAEPALAAVSDLGRAALTVEFETIEVIPQYEVDDAGDRVGTVTDERRR